MKRRAFLVSGGSTLAVLAAGCTDTADDTGDDPGAGDAQNGTEDGQQDGADDAGTDGDDGAGEDNGTDGDNETAQDGNGDDGTDGDGETDEDDEPGGENESDEGGDGEDAGEDGDGEDAAAFRETVRFADSYAFEATLQDGGAGQEQRLTGRVHGPNTYFQMEEGGGGPDEVYVIDGEMYVIDGNQCIVVSEDGDGAETPDVDRGEIEAETHEERAEDHPNVERTGTTTVDGEDVHVFEVSPDDRDETVTYYVSDETGYVRRVETGSGTIDFDSWGEVDPIEPPEMDCGEIDVGGGGDGGDNQSDSWTFF